jgi:hypothetical protein
METSSPQLDKSRFRRGSSGRKLGGSGEAVTGMVFIAIGVKVWHPTWQPWQNIARPTRRPELVPGMHLYNHNVGCLEITLCADIQGKSQQSLLILNMTCAMVQTMEACRLVHEVQGELVPVEACQLEANQESLCCWSNGSYKEPAQGDYAYVLFKGEELIEYGVLHFHVLNYCNQILVSIYNSLC